MIHKAKIPDNIQLLSSKRISTFRAYNKACSTVLDLFVFMTKNYFR